MGSMPSHSFTALRTLEPPAQAPIVAAPRFLSGGKPLRGRSAIFTLLIVAAAILGGLLIWWAYFSPVPVSVAPVQADIREQVFGLGTVGARVQSNVGFKVAGVLVALKADQGDRVQAGHLLAQLDARDVEAQLALAKAGVAQALANIDKSKSDVVSAAATLENAQAVSARRNSLVEKGFASVEEAQTNEAVKRVATANLASAKSGVRVADATLQSAEAQEAFEQATLRDMRHNGFRFVLTAIGLGLLLGIVVAMAGIYEGALDDALRLPRASSPDLWVVQPRTMGPFAEPSRIPRDTRDLVQRIPGVSAAGSVTFQTVQTAVNGKPVRLFIQGYEPGRLGGPEAIATGHDITESHYQIVADASSGLKLGDEVPVGPFHDLYTVVGLTRGMVASSGDAVAWITLLDAQSIQFTVPPALERREKAAGRTPPITADINAVLVRLAPGVPTAAVSAEIDRWKHLSAVPEQQEEKYLTVFVIEKMQRQLGLFMVILIAVSAVIISLIIYTLTMDKLRSIATLKLVGAPDRTIIGLIVQQALILGVSGFAIGVSLTEATKGYFPRRVLLEPRDIAIFSSSSWSSFVCWRRRLASGSR